MREDAPLARGSGVKGRFGVTVSRSLLTAATALAVAAVTTAYAGDPAAGRKKASMCRTCHGYDGIARIPNAPHIAGENALYLQGQLKAFRTGKRRHEIMSVIAGQLSDEDISDLSAWYSSIRFEAVLPD